MANPHPPYTPPYTSLSPAGVAGGEVQKGGCGGKDAGWREVGEHREEENKGAWGREGD